MLRGLDPEPGLAHGAAPGVGVDVVVDVGLELLQTVLGEGRLAQRAVEDGLDLVSGLRARAVGGGQPRGELGDGGHGGGRGDNLRHQGAGQCGPEPTLEAKRPEQRGRGHLDPRHGPSAAISPLRSAGLQTGLYGLVDLDAVHVAPGVAHQVEAHLPLPQEAAPGGAGLATHGALDFRKLNILSNTMKKQKKKIANTCDMRACLSSSLNFKILVSKESILVM